ncbi:MAG: sulfotransferase, partial [Phycisphaerales bacterium]|nr:sulfotransferase [Phycisphaerales bacterium]
KMPRSGSTLLEQILSSHPAAAAGGELGLLARAARTLGLHRPGRGVEDVPRAELDAAAASLRASLAQHASPAGRPLISESAPNNDVYLGLFAVLFPDAPVIWCRRHPWDTCLSCYFQDFSDNLPWAFRLEHIAEYRATHDRLYEHWLAVSPNPMLTLEYEALTAQPEPTIRDLLAHLGLPWDEACLTPHRNRRVAVTPSNAQVNQPISTAARHRYLRYRDHLSVLAPVFPLPGDQPR